MEIELQRRECLVCILVSLGYLFLLLCTFHRNAKVESKPANLTVEEEIQSMFSFQAKSLNLDLFLVFMTVAFIIL